MRKKNHLVIILAMVLILPCAMMILAAMTGVVHNTTPPRPEGPCDIYTAAGTPCVAAHSSTRALYASFNGPLLPGYAPVGRQDPRYRSSPTR